MNVHLHVKALALWASALIRSVATYTWASTGQLLHGEALPLVVLVHTKSWQASEPCSTHIGCCGLLCSASHSPRSEVIWDPVAQGMTHLGNARHCESNRIKTEKPNILPCQFICGESRVAAGTACIRAYYSSIGLMWNPFIWLTCVVSTPISRLPLWTNNLILGLGFYM